MTSNIFGKPISGEVNRYSSGLQEQSDPQLLVDALNAVLDLENVEGVRWAQYTPYFNDGDACEFTVYIHGVKLKGVDEDEGDYEDGYLEIWGLTYVNSEGRRPYSGGVSLTDEEADLIHKLEVELESGRHLVVLNELFGDPAEVTATAEGLNIEYYDHD